MTKADKTLRDLGQLYDFYQEIRKARVKGTIASNKAVEVTGSTRAGSLRSKKS